MEAGASHICAGVMSPPPNQRSRGGFTLVELLITIALLGILAGLALPMYFTYIEKAKRARAIVEIRAVARAIDEYVRATGALPNSLPEAGVPSNLPDPWGNPYQYERWPDSPGGSGDPGGKGKGGGKDDGAPPGQQRKHKGNALNTDYDLYSMGPDGKSVAPVTGKPSRDDIVRADDGNYVGTSEGYIMILLPSKLSPPIRHGPIADQ